MYEEKAKKKVLNIAQFNFFSSPLSKSNFKKKYNETKKNKSPKLILLGHIAKDLKLGEKTKIIESRVINRIFCLSKINEIHL